jgi:hypothetical protein
MSNKENNAFILIMLALGVVFVVYRQKIANYALNYDPSKPITGAKTVSMGVRG